MKCIHCDGEFVVKKVPYTYKGKYFGEFEAKVCDKCGATYFMEESGCEIERIAKELEVWGEGRSNG